MQLTSHTDYALRLLIYLMCNRTRKVSTREVADAYGISLNHLTKVAKSLVKAGWIHTARGIGGGLEFAPNAGELSVGDVVRYTENTMDMAECFDKRGNRCPIVQACRLKSTLYRARDAFFEVLDATTLRDLVVNQAELNSIFSRSGRR